MKKFVVFAIILMMAVSVVPAFSHTGTLVNDEPGITEIVFENNNTIITEHDETIDNPMNAYKGWWWVNLTNNTGVAWTNMHISAGAGNLVAIVQGNGLEDEWGFIGNSVVVNKAGTANYSGSYGSRVYENSVVGQLWAQMLYTFSTPVANGQKVGFKIYTDNSYYEGPYASTFNINLTPNVPEPSGVVALIGGIASFGGYALRRRK